MFEYMFSLVTDEFKVVGEGQETQHSKEQNKVEKSVKGKYIRDLEALRDNGYSLVCWSTIKGWVAINYDVEDGNHADIKAFCYSDASILEECYNKGYFDE